jgi:hypothetical protein
MPCTPLDRATVPEEPDPVPVEAELLPQAVATSASVARPLRAMKLRFGVRIEAVLLYFAETVIVRAAPPEQEPLINALSES